jgi:hypothetical protein
MDMYEVIKQVGIGGLGAVIAIYLIGWITTKLNDRIEKIQTDSGLIKASTVDIFKKLETIEQKYEKLYEILLTRGTKRD